MTLTGTVGRIINGDLFVLEQVEGPSFDPPRYGSRETISLGSMETPELRAASGRRSHVRLRRWLGGQRVRVEVAERDRFGRMLAVSIEILPM